MKNELEIISLTNGKFALIDGFKTIKKGDKFINKRGISEPRKVEINCGILGYTSHLGFSFLYLSENTHRRFIKYITKTDLNKLAGKRKYTYQSIQL